MRFRMLTLIRLMSEKSDWASQRSLAASEHLARLNSRQDREHRQAEALLQAFARAAGIHGLETASLRAQGYSGHRSVRTPLFGWYLRRDRKAALDTDGNYYHLVLPLGLGDYLRGVSPTPSRPPLVLGAGGRDGDSITLAKALDRLLPGWATT